MVQMCVQLWCCGIVISGVLWYVGGWVGRLVVGFVGGWEGLGRVGVQVHNGFC